MTQTQEVQTHNVQVHDVTMSNFESVVDSHRIVLLDFWASWCQPCQLFAPVFEAAAKKHSDIYFGKVNTETATDLAEAFQVRSIPTVMAFVDSDLVFEQPGMLPSQVLDDLINKLREAAAAKP